jgi:three-Cys-motif partner protein
MLRDSDPAKWVCKAHTRVKHELLEKYLHAWIPILGSGNPRIAYFDGFAGRGAYDDDSPGSPVIAVRVADQRADYFNEIGFTFVEKDPDNYANLQSVLKRELKTTKNVKRMEFRLLHDEFSNVAGALLDFIEKWKSTLVPSFFFIDPFGFTGVPFDIVRRILASPKTEVFFTFMLRDVNRFLELPQLAGQMTELYGGECWKGLAPRGDRRQALVELYRSQLHDMAGAKYSLHFKLCESDSTDTLYHLIHANNNFKGHEIMKGIMYNQGANGTFAYLGKKDLSERTQMRLFDPQDTAILARELGARFAGQTLAFDAVREAMCHPWYQELPFVEKHYRAALKDLAKEGIVKVEPVTSKTSRGLSGLDRVTFA